MKEVKLGRDHLKKAISSLELSVNALTKYAGTGDIATHLFAVLIYLDNILFDINNSLVPQEVPKKDSKPVKKPVSTPVAKKPVPKVQPKVVKKVVKKVVQKPVVKKPSSPAKVSPKKAIPAVVKKTPAPVVKKLAQKSK